jgi:RNA polymerase sigma-70 factor (ECF subfamily)
MISDEHLMERVRDDVPGAFEELLERYRHRVVNLIDGWAANTEEAEDLAQEFFMCIYRSRKTYVTGCKFSLWLHTIARNNLLKKIADELFREHGTQPE